MGAAVEDRLLMKTPTKGKTSCNVAAVAHVSLEPSITEIIAVYGFLYHGIFALCFTPPPLFALCFTPPPLFALCFTPPPLFALCFTPPPLFALCFTPPPLTTCDLRGRQRQEQQVPPSRPRPPHALLRRQDPAPHRAPIHLRLRCKLQVTIMLLLLLLLLLLPDACCQW
jgi:hypothetical protein